MYEQMQQAVSEAQLFRPVPSIVPEPLPMQHNMRMLLQNSNIPGGVALIEHLMRSGGCDSHAESVDIPDTHAASPMAGKALEMPSAVLGQWLDAVLASSCTRASEQLEALAPFFFRLAAFHPHVSIARKAVILASRSL